MGTRSSRTANRLDHALREVDRNLADAAATVAVEKVVQRHYHYTANLLNAVCSMARRRGASHATIVEALANCAADMGDDKMHTEIIGSLFRERR